MKIYKHLFVKCNGNGKDKNHSFVGFISWYYVFKLSRFFGALLQKKTTDWWCVAVCGGAAGEAGIWGPSSQAGRVHDAPWLGSTVVSPSVIPFFVGTTLQLNVAEKEFSYI